MHNDGVHFYIIFDFHVALFNSYNENAYSRSVFMCRVPLPCLCDPKGYCFTLKVCSNIINNCTFGRIDTLSFSVSAFDYSCETSFWSLSTVIVTPCGESEYYF